jgi:carbon storage regulator
MLVLTRSEGQSILIGDGVKVTVVSTKGGQVRFGIDAPRDVTILREEVGKRNARKDPA